MPAPDLIPYTDAQIGDHPSLAVGHHAAVDVDDDEGATMAIVAASYDHDEDGTSVTLRISTIHCDHLTVDLYDGTLYDGPGETDGISAAAVARRLRAAMADTRVGRRILFPGDIDALLDELGL